MSSCCAQLAQQIQRLKNENGLLIEKNEILKERLEHFKDRYNVLSARHKYIPHEDRIQEEIPIAKSQPSRFCVTALQRKDVEIESLRNEVSSLRLNLKELLQQRVRELKTSNPFSKLMLDMMDDITSLKDDCQAWDAELEQRARAKRQQECVAEHEAYLKSRKRHKTRSVQAPYIAQSSSPRKESSFMTPASTPASSPGAPRFILWRTRSFSSLKDLYQKGYHGRVFAQAFSLPQPQTLALPQHSDESSFFR